jgi:cytoskeletal protein CcmA (bactofilin family)
MEGEMGLFGFGNSKAIGRVDTVIGQETSLRGSYNAKNSIRVDGEIYGNVTSEDGIIVGDKGMVRGNIVAKTVLVSGKVKGNITAYQRLELQPTAQVEGDVTAPVFIIEEGAMFEGNCQMEQAVKIVEMPKTRES